MSDDAIDDVTVIVLEALQGWLGAALAELRDHGGDARKITSAEMRVWMPSQAEISEPERDLDMTLATSKEIIPMLSGSPFLLPSSIVATSFRALLIPLSRMED